MISAAFSRVAIIVCGAFVLTACASLSEKQCSRGDWQGIGYRDGANGYTEFRVSDHQEACAKYGITPDGRAYESGRKRGLEAYCTTTGGLRAGRNGNSYAGVCPAEAEPAFLQALQLGLELNRLESHLNEVRSERNSIYYRLRELSDRSREDRRDNKEPDRNDQRDNNHRRENEILMIRLRELEREEWRLDNDYRHLEWEARRLK